MANALSALPWPTIALIASLTLTFGIGVWLYRRAQRGRQLNLVVWLLILCCPTLVYSVLHALSGWGAGAGCLFMPIVSIVIISIMANWQKGAGLRGNLTSGSSSDGGWGGFDGGSDGGDGGGGGDSGFD
jgi:hypothetical protein